MSQTTLFYPICDSGGAGKITASSVLLLAPIFGAMSIVFVALGFVFLIVKILSLFIVEAPQDSTPTTSAN